MLTNIQRCERQIEVTHKGTAPRMGALERACNEIEYARYVCHERAYLASLACEVVGSLRRECGVRGPDSLDLLEQIDERQPEGPG
jgi:hypothetical protein